MTTDGKFTETFGFRGTVRMREAIESHQRSRRLTKFSDAAREVMEAGIQTLQGPNSPVLEAATTIRAAGRDPLDALLRPMEDAALAEQDAQRTTTSP